MKNRILVALLLLMQWATYSASLRTLQPDVPRTRYLRVRIQATLENMGKMSQLGIAADHGSLENGYYTTEISDTEYALMRNQVPSEIVVSDMERFYSGRAVADLTSESARTEALAQSLFTCSYTTPTLFSLGSMGSYLTLDEMLAELDEMAAAYPNLITVRQPLSPTLTTAQGRQVFYVKISDNPTQNESEPEVLYTAVHHAREPMSLMSLIFYMHYILENYATDPAIKQLVDSTEMYFVPCLNPDGYVYNQTTNPNGGGMWRKNRRNNGNGTFGVDLNRNYAFQWGLSSGSSGTSSSETYRGPSPFSEPETQMMRDFCNTHQFVTSFNEHAYASVIIHPWDYQNSNPDPATFNMLGADLVSCNAWPYGTAFQMLGYLASGTATDWMYGEQGSKPRIHSFTPEIGTSAQGFWPVPSAIVPLCNSMMYANLKIADYAIYLTLCGSLGVDAGADATVCSGNSTNLSVTVTGGTAPFSYSWNTGATNQGITVTPAVTTTYTVTVTDANGCARMDSVVVNVQNCATFCSGGTQVTLNTEGFETGTGIWVDGGTDCARVVGNANTGQISLRLRDDTTTSVLSTGNLNLGAYGSVQISFSYICSSFDNSAEDFWLQVSTDGGSTYTTVEEWNLGDEITNGVRKNESVVLQGPFTSTMRLRFRCHASADDDAVYLDDIVIRACQ